MTKKMGGFQQTLVSLLLLLGGCTMFLVSRDTEEEVHSQRVYSTQNFPMEKPAAAQVFFPTILSDYSAALSETVTPGLPESGGRSDYCGYCVNVRKEGEYAVAKMRDGREVYVWGWEGTWWKDSDILFQNVNIGPDGRLYATSVSHCE